MESTTIYRYAPDGTPLGALDYVDATHEEDLDGTDMLEVTCDADVRKRDRLVWRDGSGTWHEHLVDSARREHSGTRARTRARCSNSVSELYLIRAEGTVLEGSARQILGWILGPTRWRAADGDVRDWVRLEVWRKDVRQCLAELADLCGAEMETVITVDGSGVASRAVRLVRARGGGLATRQFAYGRNVANISREECQDEVYTAIVGYGAKADEEDDDEYAERISVTLYSDADVSRYGAPGPGGMGHSFATYVDDGCPDRLFLMEQARKQLESLSKPLVRYEFEVEDVGASAWADVTLGQTVSCVDDEFDPPLELMERVSHVKRRLRGSMSMTIAIGERSDPLVQRFTAGERQQKASTGNSTRSESRNPSYSGGSYRGSQSGGNSSGGSSLGGGDRWTHQIDGVTQETGTINFVTTGGSTPTPDPTPTQTGDMGGKHNVSLWELASSQDSDPAGGGGGLSGGGGNGWGTGGGGGAF